MMRWTGSMRRLVWCAPRRPHDHHRLDRDRGDLRCCTLAGGNHRQPTRSRCDPRPLLGGHDADARRDCGRCPSDTGRGGGGMTAPTPLAEQIAREHHLTTRAKCACPDALDAGGDMHAWVAHIATVTERAVRDRMRTAGPTLEIHAYGATPEQADAIFTAAMDA